MCVNTHIDTHRHTYTQYTHIQTHAQFWAWLAPCSGAYVADFG